MAYESITSRFQSVPGVTNVLVSNKAGQMEYAMSEVDAQVGGVAYSMHSNIKVQIKRMQRGNLQRLVLETDKGLTLLSEIGGDKLLIVFANVTEGFNLSQLMEIPLT